MWGIRMNVDINGSANKILHKKPTQWWPKPLIQCNLSITHLTAAHYEHCWLVLVLQTPITQNDKPELCSFCHLGKLQPSSINPSRNRLFMSIWVDIFSLVSLLDQLPVWCVAVLVVLKREQKSFCLSFWEHNPHFGFTSRTLFRHDKWIWSFGTRRLYALNSE